ncbi:methyltransferase domain-containing protein [Paenibacillus sp. PSB04]|uniref:methyltransferase domain-containing protein n=1 Tax=Paenibacillus sp. PSB04 TaxID=2866810 RepID=UPI0021F2163B|nr:methyltransferase domain-containing protein [Paenibacillus sp. PSB04]UYO05153.1 methyltransferase domain-containing protein [Paenibacillus sp. PSB04]
MATLNLDYSTGKDQYVDNEEDILLAHYSGEALIEHPRDSLFYLTTKERENILAWYSFQDKDVLEIGSGCGCITGTLCDSSKRVVSVDQSQKRARITFERHKERENLEVYAGNVADIPFEQKFDYVVLIGVLEYARRFFSEYPEDVFFLKMIRKLLKPEGVLLIAIENRYGIKYFAGANEDHLGEPYVSLGGYSNRDVRTYGKQELEELLDNCGFPKTKFYYPFPDYKLPSIIYSDEQPPSYGEAAMLPIYTYGNAVNFSIQETMAGIVKNGQFGFFSNSFLVEAGTDQSQFSDISFAKFQPKRTEDYQIISVKKNKKTIVKRPRSAGAKAHLDNYQKIHEKLGQSGFNICKVLKSPTEDEWCAEFIEGKSISELVDLAGEKNGKAGIRVEIQKFLEFLYKNSDIVMLDHPVLDELKELYVEPTYVLKYGLMDLNASNIIYHSDIGYTLIDQEWEESRQIPTDYAVLNSLGYLYSTCSTVKNYYSLMSLLEDFGLSHEKVSVLEKISDIYLKEPNPVLDKEKCLVFEQLSQYDIIQNSRVDWEVKYTALSSHTKKVEDELHHQNEQVGFLSEHYNRVVTQIKQMDDQLRERNEEVAELSKHYNIVVDRIRQLEKQLEERNQQLTDLSTNYNRVVKLVNDLEKHKD